MNNELMIFEGHEVEVLNYNGQALFNPRHVADVLDISDVNSSIRKFNEKQVIKLTNSKMHNMQFRKLHNTGENFLTESGVYKLTFKSKKPNAEKFTDWIADEVLPSIRKNGYYEVPSSKQHAERLASVNNAVKILTPMLQKAGCNSTIQLLTAKSLYEKAGVSIPIEILADQQYFDTVQIARKVGIYTKSNKPASGAVNEIIRRIIVTEDEYTETWESKNKWQGTVRKYTQSVIEKVQDWLIENDYPDTIEFIAGGDKKRYHVVYKGKVVATA